MKCTSCHTMLVSEDDFTKFTCPSCTKETVIRCKTCRLKSTVYVCGECGFEGP